MLVSVVMATYKRDKTLKKALKSLVDQTYSNIEIILVDDNANKEWNIKVEAIVNEISNKYPIVYIQNEVNKGSAETRNIGIKKSTGNYITFLDDDDIYLPNKIKNQVEHMIEIESDFSITDLELLNENGKRIETRTRKYIKDTNKESLLKYHLMHHMTGTDTMMFKREYLLKIGGFPGIDVGDEFYLMQRAIEEGGKFSYLPTCDIKAYVHTQTDGLSSGESKINGENSLYEAKKQCFSILNKKEKRYINVRHNAVLAFAEIRRQEWKNGLKYCIRAFLISPIDCLRVILMK